MTDTETKRIREFELDLKALLEKHDAQIEIEEETVGYYDTVVRFTIYLNSVMENDEIKKEFACFTLPKYLRPEDLPTEKA